MSNLLRTGIDIFLNHIKNKFIRFIFVGVLNTLFGYGVYCLMILLGCSYIWATLISQVLGVLFNFITTGNLVFENNDKRLIFKFVLSYIITYFINIGVNKGLQIWFDCNQYVSGFGAILVSAISSFFILKLFVYRK
ncbi:MAG: GtrA family protein [Prevotella sp.]|nr:GtrA family protein [Prevotella sp.]